MALTPRDVFMGNPPSPDYRPRKHDVVQLFEETDARAAGAALAAVAPALVTVTNEAGRAEEAADRSVDARDLAETFARVDHRTATWASMAAITGSADDFGYVPDEDTGTHTDPISSGTVPNAGIYRWADDGLGSDHAERIGSTGLASKASLSVAGPFPQNRRIADFAGRNTFVADEVQGGFASNLATVIEANWSVDGDGAIDLTGTLSNTASPRSYWAGHQFRPGEKWDIEIEVVLNSGFGSGHGPMIALGGEGGSVVFVFYGNNGTLFLLDSTSTTLLSQTLPASMQFAHNDRPRLRVLLNGDGSGMAEAISPEGQRSRMRLTGLPTKGKICASWRRFAPSPGRITAFSVRPYVDAVPEPDSDMLHKLGIVGDVLRSPTSGNVSSAVRMRSVDGRMFIDAASNDINANHHVQTRYRRTTAAAWEYYLEIEITGDAVFSSTGCIIAIGDALGDDDARRIYVYLENGLIGRMTNASSSVPGESVTDAEKGYGVGDVVGMRLVARRDSTGFIEAIGPTGTRFQYNIDRIPEGAVHIGWRRNETGVIRRFTATQIEDRTDVSSGGEQAAVILSQKVRRSLPVPIASAAVNHLLFYGQSNADGADAVPVISLTQPYSNVTFSGGPRAWDGSAREWGSFKPLVEDGVSPGPSGAENRGETPCAGAANYASTLMAMDGNDPTSHVILASTAARGSYRINQLEKDTAWYDNNFLPMVSAAFAIDADHACHAVCWIQGERDADEGTAYATYKTKLIALQSDTEADIAAINSQDGPTYLLVGQVTAYARKNDDTARAQFDAALESSKIFVVYPSYRIPYINNIHFTAPGSKLAGAYFGRAYKQMRDGFEPDVLKPISATVRGAVVRVRFDVPHLPLVLDTDNLAEASDAGFRVLSNGSPATIEGVAIDGRDVLITLSAAPTAPVLVRYALDHPGAGRSISSGDEGCGNLRDSAPEEITIGASTYQLFNAAPAFQMNVVRLGE